jgi:protoporphyrinogen oxidase
MLAPILETTTEVKPKAQSWAVIGGGMLGMTVAEELARLGARVEIFESAPHLGGLADAWTLGDITWDRHYHVITPSDTQLLALLEEIGLTAEIQWAQTRTGFYSGGRLYPMSTAADFFRFPLLGLTSKVRLAATMAYASRIRDWKRLEQIPVDEWLLRCSGHDAFDTVWKPLLLAKLGESYHDTSAAFIWATIVRLYKGRVGGKSRGSFGYVGGGYARILEKLESNLRKRGVSISLSSGVRGVRSSPDKGVAVEIENGVRQFDGVIVTTPAPLAVQLCPGLTDSEKRRLRGVRYLGVLCASLLLSEPLADYYITNIADATMPFTAVIETSSFVDRRWFGGRNLVYLPKYLGAGDPFWDFPDDQIQEAFLTGLARMYPRFRRDQVLAFRISRARHVMPLPAIGYSQRLPPVRGSLPGVFFLNSGHIVNGTLNVNETIALAREHLPAILETLSEQRA